MTKYDKEVMDAILQENDDQCIERGEPILSVLVVHDDGAVSTAFWKSVEKHKLRLPLESDEHCIKRLRELAFAFHKR